MITPEQTGLLERVAARFRALADVSRLRLLLILRQGPRGVNALTARMGIAQAGVSKHLAVLKAAGLVECARDRNQMIYRVADQRVYDMCAVVCDGVFRQIQAQQLLLPAFPRRRTPGARQAARPGQSQGSKPGVSR